MAVAQRGSENTLVADARVAMTEGCRRTREAASLRIATRVRVDLVDDDTDRKNVRRRSREEASTARPPSGTILMPVCSMPRLAVLACLRRKHHAILVVAVSAFLIALWRNRPVVFAALVLQRLTGGLLGPAIAAISLGLVGHSTLAERLGRNQRFASAGALTTAGVMGVIGYFLSYQAIFLACASLAIPLLVALSHIRRLKSTSVALADNPITTHPLRRREHDA